MSEFIDRKMEQIQQQIDEALQERNFQRIHELLAQKTFVMLGIDRPEKEWYE